MLNQKDSLNKFFLESSKKTRIAVSISAIGIILFIVIATLSPFKDQLLNLLYPKPSSKAAAMLSNIPSDTVYPEAEEEFGDMVFADGVAYAVGDFSVVGQRTGSGVPIDTATGRARSPYPKVTKGYIYGDVYVVIPDGSGGWYIGGGFTEVGGVTRNHVAHINSDGSLDSNFNPNVEAEGFYPVVYSLALSPDKSTLYVGGRFNKVNGQFRNNLAAVETATGNAVSSFPEAVGSVDAMILSSDGKTLYIGGGFDWLGSYESGEGQDRIGIAAINTTDGTISPFYPGPLWDAYWYVFPPVGPPDRIRGGIVDAFVLSPDNKTLYFGGGFSYVGGEVIGGNLVGGEGRSGIAAVDTDTGTLTSFNPGAEVEPCTYCSPREVKTLALFGDTLYVGGSFTKFAGLEREALVAVKTTTGEVITSFNPNLRGSGGGWAGWGASGGITALVVTCNTLYIAGGFIEVGGQQRFYVGALDPATGAARQFNPTSGNGALTLALSPYEDTLYVGGEFGVINGEVRTRLVALDIKTDAVLPFNPGVKDHPIETSDGIRTAVLSSDKKTLYVGGQFPTIGGEPRSRLAAIDIATETVTSFNPGANDEVFDFVLSPDGKILYVSGRFTTIGGEPRNRLAAIDLTTDPPTVTSFNPNADNLVGQMVLSPDGKILYVQGFFKNIGVDPQPRNQLAAINTSDGSVITDFNPNPSIEAPWTMYIKRIALTLDGSTLYVVGTFTTIGGQPRKYLAGLDTTTGQATSFNPQPSTMNYLISGVAITNDGSTLYVGGSFPDIAGAPRKGFAAFNTADGSLTSWDPQTPVHAHSGLFSGPALMWFSPDDTKLYGSGGVFTQFNIYAAEYVAPSPTPTPTPYSDYPGSCVSPPSPTPTPTPTPSPTPTPTPSPTPTPTPGGGGGGGGGQGGGGSNPPPTQAPIVVPKAPPKTGRY